MAISTRTLISDESELTRLLRIVIGLSSTYVVFWIFRALYRLTFHPLASFPGPKSAAISVWWLYRQERTRHVEAKLKDLHKEYDTHILRIGPNELHIDDVSVYDEIYSQKYRFLKEPGFYAGFNAPNTVFSESMPAAHRERRKMINPFFSKQGIAAVQPLIYAKVNSMVNKIREFQGNGAIHIYSAVRCLTVDIISEYSFGQPFGLLEDVEDHKFHPNILSAFDLILDGVINFHYFPILRLLSRWMPASLMAHLDKKIAKFQELVSILVDAKASFDEKRADGHKFERPPLFDPLSSLSKKNILAESVDIIIAGSDTTATSLGYLINVVLENPHILRKLRAELETRLPDKDANWPLIELEKLEYLTACVKETLRCALAVQGRLPRIVPFPEPGVSSFIVDGKMIPPGSVVGMSATTMHHSESVWGSDSQIFKPERWLGPDSKQLEKFLVTFGKGGRQCLGINLVYAELRIATAKLFRCLDMSLDSSMTEKDLNQLDCFTTSFEGSGVRVLIHEDRP